MANSEPDNARSAEAFKVILKKNSLKATPQRLAVHNAMLNLGHASADQVSAWIEKNGGAHTTVASVYNILTQLALIGVYGHLMSLNNKMYFDVNSFRHIHLYDSVNHEYRDVMDDSLIEMVEARLKSKRFRGYKVDDFSIQIICHPSARKTTNKK